MSASGGKVLKCDCEHAFQDKTYGKNNRGMIGDEMIGNCFLP